MTRLLLFIAIFTAMNLHSQENFEVVGPLPSEVFETSGLLFVDGKLLTHNDSGNEPILYEIDTTSLAIIRTISLTNVPNTDWEDLAQDDNYIYIADFGNNVGSRTDLAVYRISKTEYAAQDQVSAEVIGFNYVDQTDFSGAQNSDFDAEALIIYQDQLIIFTKQWQSNGTAAYSIPNVPGNHVAESFDNFSSDGLITGATYDSNANVLFLSGYSQQLQPFVIRIEDLASELSFNATTTKVNLPVGFAQIEGITSIGNRYFLSSERFTNANPPVTLESTLYAFNFGSDSNPDPPPDPEPEPEPEPTPEPEEPYREGVILFKPQGSSVLSYDLFGDRQLFARAVFDTSGRLIQYTRIQDIESNELDYSVFGSGVYYLTFYLRGLTLSEPFIIE